MNLLKSFTLSTLIVAAPSAFSGEKVRNNILNLVESNRSFDSFRVFANRSFEVVREKLNRQSDKISEKLETHIEGTQVKESVSEGTKGKIINRKYYVGDSGGAHDIVFVSFSKSCQVIECAYGFIAISSDENLSSTNYYLVYIPHLNTEKVSFKSTRKLGSSDWSLNHQGQFYKTHVDLREYTSIVRDYKVSLEYDHKKFIDIKKGVIKNEGWN